MSFDTRLIISNLLHNKDYFDVTIPKISEEFFDNYSEKIVIKWIKEYGLAYKEVPTEDVIQTYMLSHKDKVKHEVYESIADLVFNLYESPPSAANLAWLVEVTEKHCVFKGTMNALAKGVEILTDPKKQDTIGKIPSIMQEALSFNFNDKLGHCYNDDIEDRIEFYHDKTVKIPSGIASLDKAIDGGFSKATLNLIAAGTHVGKSLTLCTIAANMISSGLNVIYYNYEMRELNIGHRIDANLLDIDLNQFKYKSKDILSSSFYKLKQQSLGKLYIKNCSSGKTSASSLSFHLKELRNKKGFIPDAIIVDYLGIVASEGSSKDDKGYEKLNQTTVELVALAQEYDVPLITAQQLDSEGKKSDRPNSQNISGCKQIENHCDFVALLYTTPELKKQGIATLEITKDRQGGGAGHILSVSIDYNKMRLTSNEDLDNIHLTIPDNNNKQQYQQQPKPFGVKSFGKVSFGNKNKGNNYGN